ncbi:MAG: efflux RND transporter periplasmic adaptor subunit [Herbaspirillum sp.]
MTLSFFKSRPVLFTLLILMILSVFAVAMKRPAPPVTVVNPARVLEFLPTDTVVAGIEALRQVLPLSGALRALDQVSVKARVAGDVKEVLVRAGEAVSAGQILVRMDTREYQARVDQASGALVAARGQLDIAVKTRDNNRALLDKGFISRNAFDNAASQFDIAQANVDSARGALDAAQKALSDTVIHAPIAGMISSRTVEPGEKVSVDYKLLEVVDLRRMELEAPVPTADILKVRLGQEVLVTVDGLPRAVAGKVARINPATQSGSRSIMVYVRVDNPDGLLRAGMFADASLTLDQRDAVLTVPQMAIYDDGGKTWVYAIENDRLVRRDVVLGLRGVDSGGDAVEVRSGLSDGARIVRVRLGNLSSGMPVRFATTDDMVPAAGTKE